MIDNETFPIRPYLMVNPIQPYHWGMRGEKALIAQLLRLNSEADQPYAELWMGAHPKAPSKVIVEGKQIPLQELISKAPRVFLGKDTVAAFGEQLPFLFKVLSAAEMLSIQVHPDQPLAKSLHQKDPNNYPDRNHKPEIAYVLDELECLAGFRPASVITDLILSNHELQTIFPGIDDWRSLPSAQFLDVFWQHCIGRFEQSPELVDKQLRLFATRLKSQPEVGDRNCNLFSDLIEKYPRPDIGLLLCLFLQYRYLTADQALYLPPRSLHAYIRGNILECMANSDNVVRGGLTPKFVDLPALKVVVDPLSQPELLAPQSELARQVFRIPSPDFLLQSLKTGRGEEHVWEFREGQIVFVWEGKVLIQWDKGEAIIDRGNSVFLPAELSAIVIKSFSPATIFIVSPGIV